MFHDSPLIWVVDTFSNRCARDTSADWVRLFPYRVAPRKRKGAYIEQRPEKDKKDKKENRKSMNWPIDEGGFGWKDPDLKKTRFERRTGIARWDSIHFRRRTVDGQSSGRTVFRIESIRAAAASTGADKFEWPIFRVRTSNRVDRRNWSSGRLPIFDRLSIDSYLWKYPPKTSTKFWSLSSSAWSPWILKSKRFFRSPLFYYDCCKRDDVLA